MLVQDHYCIGNTVALFESRPTSDHDMSRLHGHVEHCFSPCARVSHPERWRQPDQSSSGNLCGYRKPKSGEV